VLSLLLPSYLNAGTLTFAWDASNSTQNVTGYKLYFGYGSGSYYSNIDVGNVTTVLITDLDLTRDNYFALTAYRPCKPDDLCCVDGNTVCESTYSNEVSYLIPLPLPQPASNGTIQFDWVDPPEYQYFEDFEGCANNSDPEGWIDTAAGNSMAVDDSIFKVSGGALSVKNTGINVHSHYEQVFSIPFTFTGKMKRNSGGVGVTFLSDYPNSDTYYRLRSQGSDAFHIAPHPDSSASNISGQKYSGVTPVAGQWYQFKIEVPAVGKINAKVWPDGQSEPGWQINCTISSPILTQGKIGAWSMQSSNNLWDDLKVE